VLTLLLYGLLAVLVVGILFVAAVYFLPRGEELVTPAPDSRTWALLPRGQLQPEDVTRIRLPVALRGYRFAETDLLLDRLTDELRTRDEEITRLRGGGPTPAPPAPPAPIAPPLSAPARPATATEPSEPPPVREWPDLHGS
jgi:hypothetical protein